MNLAKKYSKLFLIASTFSLFVNTFFPLFYAFPVIAQDTTSEQTVVEEQKSEEPEVKTEDDSTDSSEEATEEEKTEESNQEVEQPSEEEKVEEPTPTPVIATPTPKPSVTATPTPTPTVEEETKESPTNQEEDTEGSEDKQSEDSMKAESEQKDSLSEITYEELAANKIRFVDTAQAGVWYEYKDSGFKVKFTKLEGEARLVIEEISLSDEQVKNLNTVSNKAYDVYFDPKIENGNFEYELQYPVSESSNDVQVKYTEDKDGLEKGELTEVEQEVKVEDGSAKVEGLDHFTTFVVTDSSPASSGPFCIAEVLTPATDCFNTLADAVAAASSNDTIKIANGDYTENTNISLGSGKDGITIEGETKSGVILRTKGSWGFDIQTDGVTLKNMTLYDESNSIGYHVKVYQANDFTIEDVDMYGNSFGTTIKRGALDINSAKNAKAKNVYIEGYYKNGYAITSQCDSSNTSEDPVVENVSVKNVGWNGFAFQLSSGPSCNPSGSAITGVDIKGTNKVENAGQSGFFVEGSDSLGIVDTSNNPVDLGNFIFTGTFGFGFITNLQINDLVALTANFDGVTNINPYSADLDSVESMLVHDCNDSPYLHGICNAADLSADFGSIEYVIDSTGGQCVEQAGYPLSPSLNKDVPGFTVLGTQKNGNLLPAERSDLGNAVGMPNGDFLSLGVGGVWVFVNEVGVIKNVDGYDLSFHEITNGRDTYPEELLKVEVSQNLSDWVEIGTVSNKSSDGGPGVGHLSLPDYWTWAKFVRVTDVTDYTGQESNADGYDLDAIDVVMQGCDQPDYEPIPPKIPRYESNGQCRQGVPLESTKQTVVVSSTDIDGESVTLDTGKEYLFRAYGTFVPSSGSGKGADAGYTTRDGWVSIAPEMGINGTGDTYGAHALLGDLGAGVGVINWGTFNTLHSYDFYYMPTTSNVHFVVGDRYSNWFNTPYDNQSGMSDNSGSLNVDILECGTPNGEVKGYKYIGEQEIPKQGVEINICPVDDYGESCNGDTQSTNTNGSGYYEFKDLTPGVYKVWETITPGFEPMYPAGGTYYVDVLGGTSYKYLGNLVNNGSFENPVVTHNKKWDIYPDGTSGLGWKVEWNGGSNSFNNATRPSVANLELHRGVNSWASDGGSQHAELDTDWDGPNGSLNNEPANVKITQRVPQCTDGTFDFSYAYSPRPNQSNNSMQVFWNGVLETRTASGGNNVNWQTVAHPSLVSTGTFGFAENGTGNALGMFVDDVVIEQNADCSDGFVNFYNKQTGIPKVTINVNKYNDSNNDGKVDGESKIDDWGIVIHKIDDNKLIEEFDVNSNDYNGEDTTNSLDSSKKYLIEVTGTWTNNGSRAVDADYYSDNSWSTVKDLDTDNTRDKRQLDLVINNSDVNWASYNPSHLYKYVMAGTDSTVNFRIFDEDNDTNKPSWYNDNVGSLHVKIYDVTDEYYTTPVSVQVEPGEYQIVEELRPGWDQTYPINPSYYHETIGEGQEYNFDFANYQVPTTTNLQVCKIDDNQTPLSGWKISLLGEKQETIEVKPDGNTYSSSVLSNDDYVLVAHGSYEYRGNTGLITDPAYSERRPTDSVYSGPYVPFVNVMDLGTPGALGIKVNGSATNWSSYYNPAHVYHLGYPGYNGKFDFSVYDDNYSDNVGKMYVDIYKGYSGVTGENGCYTLQDVEYGNYDVSEVLMPNWENTSGLGNTEVNSRTKQITVVNHKNVYDIHGFKFDDINGDSEFDVEGESRLAGWTIFIDTNGNKKLDEGETSTTTSSDQNDYGWYWFKGLPVGEYSICEVQQDGWSQTFPQDNACHTVTVPYGQNLKFSENEVYAPEYNFGNHFEDPELTIEKFNNVNNGAILSQKGGFVTYTLQVTANKNNVNDVVVTDLPPLGFTVQNPGTWQVTSNVNGTFTVDDPAYASPGDWKVGDMQAGETITITYTAKIDENIDPGLYKDLAFAVGGNPRTEEDILATAQPTGYIDTNYVGTAALIDEDNDSPNADADIDEETKEEEIVEEGDVLGASTTSLPATGSPMWVITLALILLASGISIVVYSKKKKSMKVLVLPLALITMFTFTFSGVNAAGLSVRVEDPKTPTNKGFDLSFVAMDTDQRPVTAKCLVKKPGSASFVQFEDSSLISGGTSHSCSVNTTVLTTEGSFEFKVEVEAGGDTAEDTTTVFYDGTNPGKPKDLNVDKKNSCKYEIDFKTANDGGQTSYVEIYRDDSTSFTVNDTTRIASISAGSNEKVEYTDNLAGSQCGSRQYYAVRAFDSSGNASDVLGEDVVEIKYVTTTTTSSSSSSSSSTSGSTSEGETGAIAAGTGGSVLGTGGENSENSEVIAEENETSETGDNNDNSSENGENTSNEENGEVKGAFTKAISNKWVIILSIFGLIGVLALVLSYVKGRKTAS